MWFGFVNFVIVLILPHLSHSLGSGSRFNWVPCFVSLHPLRRSTLSAVSAHMKWGLNGLSRPCHITCFFTSTIRRRPRLTSRALLLSLFSMPDKLSGCRLFRFFPEKWPHSDFPSPILMKKNLCSIAKKKMGKLERTFAASAKEKENPEN